LRIAPLPRNANGKVMERSCARNCSAAGKHIAGGHE
jgi:hypothetical protein